LGDEEGSRGWMLPRDRRLERKGCLASWLATLEAIRFLSPLERLGAGRSEPHRSLQERRHEAVALSSHCKDACGSARSRMDTVIRTFAPGELLSAIGYQLTA
jgi:hypothetical protein